MSTQDVLKIVEKRGLKIALKDGRPVLSEAANNPNVTDKLLMVLKIHRDKIIEHLTREARP